jgi:hypothetical protein
MYHWCQVRCNCPNRALLPGLKEFRQKLAVLRHQSPEQQRIWNDWTNEAHSWTYHEMYRCGHRRGVIVEFSSDNLYRIRDSLNELLHVTAIRFPVWDTIISLNGWNGAPFQLSPDQTVVWQQELMLVLTMLNSLRYLDSIRIAIHTAYPNYTLAEIWESVIDRKYSAVQDNFMFHAHNLAFLPSLYLPTEDIVQEERRMHHFLQAHLRFPDLDHSYPYLLRQIVNQRVWAGDVDKDLLGGLHLCHASVITGNPIEFMYL